MSKIDIINQKWKTEPCHSGTDCWCRLISTEIDHGPESLIVSFGALNTENAEHIVKIHNEWLEAQNGPSEAIK